MELYVVGVATKLLNKSKSNQNTPTHSNQKSNIIDKEEIPYKKEFIHTKKNCFIPKIVS